MLNLDGPDLAFTEVVKHVGGFYEDFRQTMQTVTKLESVLFFSTILYGEEAHAVPVVIPAAIANRLMGALSMFDLMDETQFADYITKVFRIVQINSMVPAPVEFHLNLLEMLECIVINGLQSRPDVLAELSRLRIGDLVLFQFMLQDDRITTGVRVVPNALSIYEQSVLLSVPTSHLVH